MRKKLAKEIIRSIEQFAGNNTTFHIRKVHKREWKEISFQFLKPEHDVIAVFCIGDDSLEYWFVFVNHRLSNPDNYYLVVHSRPSGGGRFVVEMHTVNEGTITWTYHPRARDGYNLTREKRFRKLYGSTEVTIPLPIEEITVDEFLSGVFCVMDIRETAHDVAVPIGRDEAFPEGTHVEKMHKFRERSSRVVREAKRLYAKRNRGRSPCEVCGFDFAKIYGKRGTSFIEAHHRIPLSDLDGQRQKDVKTKTSDLAMVCSNCHRMLHRSPWLTVEELREQVIG